MAENLYFKRTSKKATEADISDIISDKLYSHFYHKFDGTHVDLHWKKGEPVQMITRDGNDIAHLVPYLTEAIEKAEYMEAYQGVYACELVNLHLVVTNPKDSWSASRRALGVKEYKGNEENYVHCVMYDVYERDSENVEHLPYLERLYKLMPPVGDQTVYSDFVGSVQNLDGFYIPKPIDIKGLQEAWDYHVLASKREGFVLFNMSGNVKWEHTFTKLKPDLDIDCVVTGYNLGAKGKQHDGKLGAFNIGLYKDGKLVDIGKCPTMTQSERDRWTERMLNKDTVQYVIQVKASEVTTAGKLRFPSYVRERTDKKPEECIYEQLD